MKIEDATQEDLDEVLEDIKEYVGHAVNEALSPEPSRLQRRLELHPSSFPYCPLRHLFNSLQEAPAHVGMTGFSSEYFTSVGTLVHSLIQRFMAIGGRVWGHWKCVHHDSGLCRYSDLEELSPYHDCPVCGSRCEYEEVGYNINNLLIGHQDCMYEDKKGRFWVIDYKTCMLMKAQKHAKDGVTLSKNVVYRAQQRSYVALAHRKYGKTYGIKPRGWVLVYLPRDNPFQFQVYGQVVSLEEKKQVWNQIHVDMESLTTVLDATCFEDIEHLIPLKPCKSMEHYRETVHDDYNPCPLTAVCFNSQLVPTLKSEMKGHVLLPIRKHLTEAIHNSKLAIQSVKKAQSKHPGKNDD